MYRLQKHCGNYDVLRSENPTTRGVLMKKLIFLLLLIMFKKNVITNAGVFF